MCNGSENIGTLERNKFMKNDAHFQELYTIFFHFIRILQNQIERMKIDAECVINVPSLTRFLGCFAPALK
jgi:hypothetical protein